MKFSKKPPYIIAEIGINHDGRISNAKKLIKQAKNAGASAVKFQIFKASSLGAPNSKVFKFFEKLKLDEKQLIQLMNLSKKLKIDFICSVFDKESLDIAKKLNLKKIKIASSEVTNSELLKEISKTKKKIILSLGMANEEEIADSLKILKNNSVELLHCVSIYPCEINETNLRRMISIKNKFKKEVGYSDHSIGNDACKIALLLGAKTIEKHFTYNKNLNYGDHKLSADFKDLLDLVNFSKKCQSMMGSGKIKPSNKERKFSKLFRKGIYSKQNIKKNEIISLKKLEIRRPETIYKIKNIYKIVGKKAKKEILKDKEIFIKNIY